MVLIIKHKIMTGHAFVKVVHLDPKTAEISIDEWPRFIVTGRDYSDMERKARIELDLKPTETVKLESCHAHQLRSINRIIETKGVDLAEAVGIYNERCGRRSKHKG